MGDSSEWDVSRALHWIARSAALGALFLVVCLVDPASSAGTVLPLVIEVVALAVFLAAAWRMPQARRVWWALWSSQLLVVTADLVYAVQQQVMDEPAFPGLADPLYVAAYLPQAFAIALLIRSRQPKTSTTQLLDSVIVSIPVAAVAFVYVIGPTLAADQQRTVGTYLAVMYPLLDVWLLTGLIRLSVANGGHRNRSLGLLTASVATTLVADLVYSGLEADGLVDAMPGWLSGLYTAGVVLMTAAALSTDATRVIAVDRDRARPGWSLGRIVALGVASVSLPILIAVGLGSDEVNDAAVFAVAAVAVNLLIVWRGLLVMGIIDRQAARLAELSRTDPLTGLPNRRSWDYEVQRTESWLRRGDRSLTVAFLDLDQFKAFNDEHGHQAGDRLLVACAAAWTDALPEGAYLARYGGEEFTLLLPDLAPDEVDGVLEAVRVSTPSPATVSIGYARRSHRARVVDVVADADGALYLAKRRGRNRVVGVALRTPASPPGAVAG